MAIGSTCFKNPWHWYVYTMSIPTLNIQLTLWCPCIVNIYQSRKLQKKWHGTWKYNPLWKGNHLNQSFSFGCFGPYLHSIPSGHGFSHMGQRTNPTFSWRSSRKHDQQMYGNPARGYNYTFPWYGHILPYYKYMLVDCLFLMKIYETCMVYTIWALRPTNQPLDFKTSGFPLFWHLKKYDREIGSWNPK